MSISRRHFVQGSLAVGAASVLPPALFAEDKPAYVPEGYAVAYAQDFKSDDAIKDFVFTDPNAWKLNEVDGKRCLELHGKSKYKPEHRSPYNIALINEVDAGDYILEADLKQTGREYGHRDMCLFYSFVDPSNFYYTHIASVSDPHAHQIFIVDDAPRTKISEKTTKGFKWGDTWHHVSLRRKASDGLIELYVDDMSKPIMAAHNTEHARGHLGFGSFDDTGVIANVRVYSPDAKKKAAGQFKAK